MKKVLFLFVLSTLCFSCLDLKYDTQQRVWVYVEIETTMLKDTSDYFYYGQIKRTIVDKIDKNEKAKGLFTLSRVRYFNDNDLLEVYEDRDTEGSIILRIEDISKVQLFKRDPLLIFKKDQLHESALNYLKKKNQK
jgi:hypothetical protein